MRQEHKTKDKGIYFLRDSCTGAALLLELSPRKLNYITPQGGTGSSDKTYSHLALISLALNVLILQSFQRIIHSLLMLGLDFCLLEKEKTFHSQLLTLCSIVSVKMVFVVLLLSRHYFGDIHIRWVQLILALKPFFTINKGKAISYGRSKSSFN